MTTRRLFLKTIFGSLAGLYCFSFPSLIANEKQALEPSSALKITDKVQPTHLVNNNIINKPFLNAINHLETPTYDHSGQAVHPSVIDFKTEYGIEKWGGSRYWMAFTPYPNFNSAFENPSLLVSEDGLNWTNPPGIKNPLASKPLGIMNFSSRNYNSDPELIYNPDQNILLLYWREYCGGVFEKIWAKKIYLNKEFSDKILCYEKTWDYKKTGLMLSPAIWQKGAKEWYMWTTDGKSAVNLFTSPDGITWSSSQSCDAPWETWNGGYLPWHISAKPNHPKKTIEFLIAGWPLHGTMKDCQLLYATAPMSKPNQLSMPLKVALLEPGTNNQWDNGYIYRSSFVLEPGDRPIFRIWYSACSKKKAWHIGYTEGTLTNSESDTLQA